MTFHVLQSVDYRFFHPVEPLLNFWTILLILVRLALGKLFPIFYFLADNFKNLSIYFWKNSSLYIKSAKGDFREHIMIRDKATKEPSP